MEKIDIVEYISQYIELEKDSNGEYIGISPFSGKDTNPSFTISPNSGLYYDFSDSSGGNILNFIQRYHKVNFPEALKIACDYIGIGIEDIPKQLEILHTIKKFKRQGQKIGKTKHKILDKNFMQRYDFNLAKLQCWMDEGISLDVLKRYQVKYDPFSNRICFPIFDIYGNIINVKGRTLDKEFKKKYTYFYEQGELDTIFNFHQRKDAYKEKNEIILFESEKSVLKAETYGITNTAAIMTSHLNPHQMRILCELGVNIVFSLDENVDITQDKNIKLLKRFCRIEYTWNYNHIMEEKQSAMDYGLDSFKILYEQRKRLI